MSRKLSKNNVCVVVAEIIEDTNEKNIHDSKQGNRIPVHKLEIKVSVSKKKDEPITMPFSYSIY